MLLASSTTLTPLRGCTWRFPGDQHRRMMERMRADVTNSSHPPAFLLEDFWRRERRDSIASLSCRPRASAREPVPQAPIHPWVPDISLTHGTSPRAGAEFRHDSEHVRAETALGCSIDQGRTHMKVTAIETLACDAGWRNYHFVKITTDDGRGRLERVRRGLRLARRRRPSSSGSPLGSSARRSASASASMRSSTPRRGPAPAASSPRRSARSRTRCSTPRPRRLGAGLRNARRQDARPHPRVLVALRHVAHQSADLVQARHHRPRRRQGDGPRSAREEIQRAQDQHLHLRDGRQEPARAGGPASARRSIPNSTSTGPCCAICACIWRRCARAPGRTSISCSTSTSMPRPRDT